MSTWPGVKTWTATVVTVPDLNTYISDAVSALHWNVLSKSVDYTILTSDGHAVLVKGDASGAARTMTPYTAVGNAGAVICVKKTDTSTNTVTVDPNASETADGQSTWLLTSQYDYVTLLSDGTNWIVVAERRAVNAVAKTTTYTALVTDDVIEATSGTFTITLHAANAARRLRPLVITNQGTGVVTVARAGADTIVGATSLTLAQYNSVILLPNTAGTAWIIT